jgi:hypothetical protein
VPLPANSRVTVRVHEAFNAASNPGGLGRLAEGNSLLITSDVEIVAERPMYFRYTSTFSAES